MENYFHLDNPFFKSPLMFGEIYLIQIGRRFCKENIAYLPHLHLNWFELTVVTDGEGTITTNNVEVPIKSGDIYLSFPADLHQISSATPALKYDYFSFYTTNPVFNSELEKIMIHSQDAQKRIFSDKRIKTMIVNGINEFENKKASLPYSKDVLENLFRLIIIYLIRNFKRSNIAPPHLDSTNAQSLCYQIMNYIDTHIFDLKNLNELEKVTNYNYSYLSTIFKKTTNSTLQNYYQNSKLSVAKQLIKENKLKIYEIAEILNYSSVYVFSRAYKKKYGIAPTQKE